MTHFFTIALVPEKEDNVERFITENLDRYDENREVVPYLDNCICIGRKALDDANDAADSILGGTEEMAEVFRKADEVSCVSQSVSYRRYLGERKRYTDKHVSNSANRNESDPGCEYCFGIGVSPSTYNIDSKFDYYTPGGRYDRCVLGIDADSTSESESISDNIIPVKEIDTSNHMFPIAIVLPDGTWIEKGTVGLFGYIQDEMPDLEWEGMIKNIYDKHGECMAVGLDCHV